MSWRVLKDVMIGILLLVNVVLLATLYYVESDNRTLSKETVEHAVSVLSKNGITVDSSLIPIKTESLGVLPMTAAVNDPDRYANAFLGDGWSHRREEETGTDVYEKDANTVRLNGGYLKYYSSRTPESAPSEEVWKNAEEKLFAAGVRLKDARYYEKDENTRIYQAYPDGKNFFEGRLTVMADGKGITSVEGFWMVPSGSSYAVEEVQPVTEIFAQFLRDPERHKESKEITGITLGYSVLLGGAEVNYREATAIPAWRITTGDSRAYYYDARR